MYCCGRCDAAAESDGGTPAGRLHKQTERGTERKRVGCDRNERDTHRDKESRSRVCGRRVRTGGRERRESVKNGTRQSHTKNPKEKENTALTGSDRSRILISQAI